MLLKLPISNTISLKVQLWEDIKCTMHNFYQVINLMFSFPLDTILMRELYALVQNMLACEIRMKSMKTNNNISICIYWKTNTL